MSEKTDLSESEQETVPPSKRFKMLGLFIIVVILIWVLLHNVLLHGGG